MWEKLIGKRSNPMKNYIEVGAIKRFALAIGEPLLIYTDEEFAKTTPHRKIVAPPTFPRTLEYGEIVGVEFPTSGLLHGEQTFHYNRPLYAGDVVYCFNELFSFEKKESRSGKLGILKVRQFGYESKELNELIFTSTRTLILTEQLLKEVEVG